MKSLIYTVALGHPVYAAMARECVHSARRHGYAGDFVVLTDHNTPVPGGTRLPLEAVSGQLAKAGLTRALDPEYIAAYDQVLYVDADCIFTRHPDVLLAHDGLRFAVETGGPIQNYNTLFFTDREKKTFTAAHISRLNTGTILMPGQMAAEFLEAWEAFWSAAPRETVRNQPRWSWCDTTLMDQPAMQLMLFRSNYPWSGFPAGLVGFPVYERDVRHAALLHFCGPIDGGRTGRAESKEILLGRMRAVGQQYAQ